MWQYCQTLFSDFCFLFFKKPILKSSDCFWVVCWFLCFSLALFLYDFCIELSCVLRTHLASSYLLVYTWTWQPHNHRKYRLLGRLLLLRTALENLDCIHGFLFRFQIFTFTTFNSSISLWNIWNMTTIPVLC